MIRNNNRSRRAFSLVEILFAVIIIGVLTAVAIPSLFSQKGKADDSNAKQTVRTVQQLVRTAQDDSGSFKGTVGSLNLSGYLAKGEPDLKFTSTSGTPVGDDASKIIKGNTRSVSTALVEDAATLEEIVSISVIGGKDRNTPGNFVCWSMKIYGGGSTSTKYYRTSQPAGTGCKASTETSGAGQEGDFPSA